MQRVGLDLGKNGLGSAYRAGISRLERSALKTHVLSLRLKGPVHPRLDLRNSPKLSQKISTLYESVHPMMPLVMTPFVYRLVRNLLV